MPKKTTPKGFEPKSFGCHEALHMVAFLAEAVDQQLAEHDAIKFNPKYSRQANIAATALSKLYQAIGEDHL